MSKDADIAMNPAAAPAQPTALAGWFKPTGYVLTVVFAATAAFAYNVRVHGVFTCPATGYAAGYYLSYCHGEMFGDYDHGAFWYSLEPDAVTAAASADVLLLGSSRMQFGFSTAATTEWFSSRALQHYLLGFAYTENTTFVIPLLDRLAPRAKAYVINVDRFFNLEETPPAAEILHGGEMARQEYESKKRVQQIHRWLCGSLPVLCGNQVAFVRRPGDGHWRLHGQGSGDGTLVPALVSDGPDRDVDRWPLFGDRAKAFVSALPVDRRCVFLTLVPYRDTRRAEAASVAAALDLRLIEPLVTDLRTVDGSHLDEPSAERWSAAFFETAGQRIHECAN